MPKVLSRMTTGEQPRIVRAAASCPEVGSVLHVTFDHAGERFGYRHRFDAEGDSHFIGGDHKRARPESADPDERLGVEEQQNRGHPVGQ
jgi:hypothetical protein